MKTLKQESFLLFFTLLLAYSAADDSQAIQDLCWRRTGLFAHPNPLLCFQYVRCVFFSGIVQTCPDNTIWSQDEGSCVPGNRETCQRDLPPPNPDVPTQPPIDIETICTEQSFGIFEIPGNCTHFIFCLFGAATISSCPPNTPVFDINREGCFAGNPDTCEFFGPTLPPQTTINTPPTVPVTLPPTTTPPTVPPTDPPATTVTPPNLTTTVPSQTPPIATTPPPSTLPPFDICVGNNMRFVADPSSCARYFFCFLGIPLGGECDSDRIFVESLQGCVLGNQQTCERNRNINIEIITNRPIF